MITFIVSAYERTRIPLPLTSCDCSMVLREMLRRHNKSVEIVRSMGTACREGRGTIRNKSANLDSVAVSRVAKAHEKRC